MMTLRLVALAACMLIAMSAGDGDAQLSPIGKVNREAASALEAPLPALDRADTVSAYPQLASNRVPRVDSVALVQWEGEQPNVQLIDTATGDTLAQYPTGYRPTVVMRRSAHEVLVSHRIQGLEMLDVLDASDGLALKRRYPTPDRPLAKLGSPTEWATLSRDERYYAYSEITMRRELPECVDGGRGDGPSCQRTTVVILDLEVSTVPPFTYEVPRFCGPGSFLPHGVSGIAVSCNDGRLFNFSLSALASTAEGPSQRFMTDPVIARNASTASFTIESEDGWTGTLLSQGSFVWTRPGHKEVNYLAVPHGKMPRYPVWAEVGDGRLVVGYIERYYDQYPEGLAIFDMSSGRIERTLPGYSIGRTIVASGPDALLAITQDGRLVKIDLQTETVSTLPKLGDDSEAFALVR